MDLSKLPSELQSQLRSDVVVRNVSNCVIELVENALDANATCIAVRINFETFRLEVVDNGIGLCVEDLRFVGERYFTSKRKNTTETNRISKHFGYRGEGLASIKNVSSKMLIVSRTLNEDTTYCKVFEKSNSEIVKSKYDRKSVGTTVIVEKFLEKLPVRQRCIKPSEEFQTIKWFLQATALMFPKVNFSLRNDNQKSDIFHINRTNSTATTFVRLFRGAVTDSSSFVKLKTTSQAVTSKIMFSKETCNTDQLQFVFVNKRYLPQCNVHKYFNTLLDRIDPSKKKISRKIMYVLNLSCTREDYEISSESDRRCIEFKNWSQIEESLINLVKLITGDDQFNNEEKPKNTSKPNVSAVDAFRQMNTAHTVFGLPANRQKSEKPVVYDIDVESNSSDDAKKKHGLKVSNSRATKSKLFKVSKVVRKAVINTNRMKSPRLVDQGIKITYKKSPIASGVIEEKRLKNRDTFADKANASNDDFAWIWKHPDDEHDSDSTHFSGSQNKLADSRVVCSKNKKSKKLLHEKKREECYKNIVALSNQQVLRLPKRERISKKQNHYFDSTASKRNENYVIEKYGKINKNTHYVLNDRIEGARANNDAQWTAKISADHNTTLIPPVTLFDNRTSPELNFENNQVSNDDNFSQRNDTLMPTLPFHEDLYNKRSPEQEILHDREQILVPTLPFHEDLYNKRSPEQDIHHDRDQILAPTLPFHEDLYNERSPEQEIHHDRGQIQHIGFDATPENVSHELTCDRIARVEVLEPHYKVNEWISKLPPNEISLNDSANDYITPVKNSYVTDQITSDFKHKTKLSKAPDNDPPSPNRTPEKRKSTRETFEPKCKLQLNFSDAHVEEFETKKKTCPKPLMKFPILKCKYKSVHRSGPVDNDNHRNVQIIQKKSEIQILSEAMANKDRYEMYKERMSWDDYNKNSFNFHEDDDSFQPKKTQEVFTQTSDCSGHCRCKCHKKCHSPVQSISQEQNDTVILTNSTNFEPATKQPTNTFDSDRQEAEADINENDKNKNTQNTENTTVLSQHFHKNSDDIKGSEYFQSKIDLVEKLKFKMNSKFLESSSAVDIPNGMLQSVPKCESKIKRLDEDEKKAVVDLVKPYKMQDHITLDDFGNSCLRIFPMLKKQPKKSENLDSENLNCSVVFAKEDIPSFKFIAQIENKFILARAIVSSTRTPVLILLDQHAVDERIRVERLLGEYMYNGEWRSTPINPPIDLNIPFNYSSLFTDYRCSLEEFGLHFELNNRTKNKEAKLILSFTKVPTCFYNRAQREGSNTRDALKQLIESLTKEMLKKFISRSTLVHTVPNELQNVVNYEACRGAVKFGDKLTSQVCSALLEAMTRCKLPFQCAHGRPSVIPLLSFNKLAHLQKNVWKPTLNELKVKLNK